MITTLALAALAIAVPAQDATKFTHKFTKDEKTTYIVDLNGSGDGMDAKIALEFEATTKETKDGKTTVAIHVVKANANFGGQEMPLDQLIDTDIALDNTGSPTRVDMEGFQAVLYIVFMTRHLPDKALKVGETFDFNPKIDGASYKGNGSFSGLEEHEGKKYAALKSSGEFAPANQEPGKIEAKSLFDAATGKIVYSEALLGTPGGDFKMTVKIKK